MPPIRSERQQLLRGDRPVEPSRVRKNVGAEHDEEKDGDARGGVGPRWLRPRGVCAIARWRYGPTGGFKNSSYESGYQWGEGHGAGEFSGWPGSCQAAWQQYVAAGENQIMGSTNRDVFIQGCQYGRNNP
jgi:hypothetical protein